jgi:hypothetical protein
MTAKTLTDLSDLTKEMIVDLYFRSLQNSAWRKNHVLLTPKTPQADVITPIPSVHDIEMDFTAWYGGVLSLGHALEPETTLPTTNQMLPLIGQNFDRVKQAIAA